MFFKRERGDIGIYLPKVGHWLYSNYGGNAVNAQYLKIMDELIRRSETGYKPNKCIAGFMGCWVPCPKNMACGSCLYNGKILRTYELLLVMRAMRRWWT